VYVRWFDKPRISNYLRITIGKDAQMDRLFECLEDMGIK
jgi:histidinol-phosphate aminotransferase